MKAGFFLGIILLVGAVTASAEDPIAIGDSKQLFIDGKLIAKSDRIELRMNQAQKLGLIKDQNGEPMFAHVSRVIEDQGKIRLYIGHNGMTVLESDDGMQFRTIGEVSGGELATVFLDPHESDPARRYKLFFMQWSEPFDPAKHGIFASYSADGLNFSEAKQVLPFFTDNPCVVWWDPRIERYVIYTRAFDYTSENQRRIGRIETDDPLQPWPYKVNEQRRERLGIDDVDVVLSADSEDDPHSDIYYNAATLYSEAPNIYFMFTAPFRHFAPNRHPFIRPREQGWEDYGLLEVQLAVSRDGINWQRPSREPYFPPGLADEWDRWLNVMAPGMVRRGNYLLQYYVSSGRTHDSVVLRPEYDNVASRVGGIGVVKQRLDGFISADADHKGGWLETPLLTFNGNRLRLNIDTGSMGTAFVELRDADGNAIPGFTLADCEEIGGNFIDQTVYWKGNPDVSSLSGKPVRMHVKLTRGKLFAFQFRQE